jgi:asparagine synthase (glutamine-hydrolysing)
MSGICGIIYHQYDRPVDEGLLRAMSDKLHHRGPDGAGQHINAGAGLAVRGLALPGRPSVWGPINNLTGTIWAALDGQIYNRAALAADLCRQGIALRTGSDAELIANLYTTLKESCLDQLTGEFAIVIWDTANRRLLLIRDRLGVKPLYYAPIPGGIVFASELTALLIHPAVDQTIDPLGFSEYLTFAHTVPPRTLLTGVRKVAPAQVLTYQDRIVQTRPYWDVRFPDRVDSIPDDGQHIERFRAAFTTAVKRRTASGNAPTGTFLSGGMDSSAIVATLARVNTPYVHTFTGGFRMPDAVDELSRAQMVARHFATHHHELAFTAQDYLDGLPRFIAYMDDPVADEASLIRMLLAGRARSHVSVILGGEAGDDITGGYTLDVHQQRFDRIRRFQLLPRWLRQGLPGLLQPLLPTRLNAWLARGNRNLATINADEHYTMIWAFTPEEKRHYCPPLHDQGAHCHELLRNVYARSGTADPLSQAMYVLLKLWTAENLMMSADKMTASHSMEFRAPFLDHELVETAARIPSNYKVRREADGSYTMKYILKQAMRGLLPEAVIQMTKSPFQVPTVTWFQHTLAGYCEEILLSPAAATSGLYAIPHIRTLLNRHRTTPSSDTMVQIRNLLFFELWRQQVLNTAPSYHVAAVER